MLKTLCKGCKQYQIIEKEQVLDLAASNSGTLVNSAVNVYKIHIDYEVGWLKHTLLSESNTHMVQL